jgi:formylglycine-generating enzyme required for sulfatase activity
LKDSLSKEKGMGLQRGGGFFMALLILGLGLSWQWSAWGYDPLAARSVAAEGPGGVGGAETSWPAKDSFQRTDFDRPLPEVAADAKGPSADEITIMLPGGVPMVLVKIPAGSFQMGSPDTERGRWGGEDPVHMVTFSQPFYMGKSEVTQAQWEAVMGSNPVANFPFGVGPNYPVFFISWNDIAGPGGFLEKLNQYLGTTEYRLPSEAEWEYGTRGGTATRFSFGDNLSCDDMCSACTLAEQYMWWCADSLVSAQPVKSKAPNPFGLYDVHGNLSELVQDADHPDYVGAPTDGSAWVSGGDPSRRVFRGGSFGDLAQYCRSAFRGSCYSNIPYSDLGFRLARGASSGGCTISCSASASPSSSTLTVLFAGSANTSGCTGMVSYAWDFGDGATSGQQSPSHSYAAAGTYSWALTATVDGQTCSRSGSVTVPSSPLFSQQGPKLVGTDAQGEAFQGCSVSISGDGNTAIVGGWGDNTWYGAAWVWTRTGGVWNQEGPKLNGSGAVGRALQGHAVALSADGNTALITGPYDNDYTGAAWVFTRSAGNWTQQGPKLAASDEVVGEIEGWSASLSADGDTAITGWAGDNARVGAAWIWRRSGGVWTQQGPKLVGSDAQGIAWQGRSVAVSADGNTALIGGLLDNGGIGAAWVWTRSGGSWSQQGPKLVGSGNAGRSLQGTSVGLSADGNTAIVGGYGDNGEIGAAWVWTRSGGTWSQQGPKLVCTGAGGASNQGWSVSLSADGDTAVIGAPDDDSSAGASWIWKRVGGIWAQQGAKLVGSDAVHQPYQGCSVALSADGNTAIIGGYNDNDFVGAAWVYASTECPTLVLTPSSLPAGALDIAYNETITATGGAAPYGYAVTAGSLPGGLTLSSGGVLAGTPSGSGTFSFTVAATDSKGCSGSRAYTVVISSAPPPTVSGMTKQGSPFRIVVRGGGMQNGIRAYIDDVEWTSVKWQGATKITLTGGKSLKAMVPKGTIKTFRFVNPDGGEATLNWGW